MGLFSGFKAKKQQTSIQKPESPEKPQSPPPQENSPQSQGQPQQESFGGPQQNIGPYQGFQQPQGRNQSPQPQGYPPQQQSSTDFSSQQYGQDQDYQSPYGRIVQDEENYQAPGESQGKGQEGFVKPIQPIGPQPQPMEDMQQEEKAPQPMPEQKQHGKPPTESPAGPKKEVTSSLSTKVEDPNASFEIPDFSEDELDLDLEEDKFPEKEEELEPEPTPPTEQEEEDIPKFDIKPGEPREKQEGPIEVFLEKQDYKELLIIEDDLNNQSKQIQVLAGNTISDLKEEEATNKSLSRDFTLMQRKFMDVDTKLFEKGEGK